MPHRYLATGVRVLVEGGGEWGLLRGVGLENRPPVDATFVVDLADQQGDTVQETAWGRTSPPDHSYVSDTRRRLGRLAFGGRVGPQPPPNLVDSYFRARSADEGSAG